MATKIIVIKGADFSNLYVDTVDPKSLYHQVDAQVFPASSGTVSGTGLKKQGTQATITATANTGYTFSHWSDGVTTPSRTVNVGTTDILYTAIFI